MKYRQCVLQLTKTALPKPECFNYAPEILFGVSVAKTSNGRQFLTRLCFGQIANLREFV